MVLAESFKAGIALLELRKKETERLKQERELNQLRKEEFERRKSGYLIDSAIRGVEDPMFLARAEEASQRLAQNTPSTLDQDIGVISLDFLREVFF